PVMVAEFRPAVLELRPQAVDDEAELAALRALLAVGVGAFDLAVARRPGQRQHEEVVAIALRQRFIAGSGRLAAEETRRERDREGPGPHHQRAGRRTRQRPS